MTISFNPDRHSELVQILTTAADAIEAELDTLEQKVVGVRALWAGEAQDAYRRAHAQWLGTMQGMRAALNETISGAADAGAFLAQADRDAAALWE
jgi:WXG100 family type VII secretion target